MARKRMISPGFFLDEDLAELPALHRLLFIGLWTEADREGRLEDRPRRLKVAILPYDDCDIDTMLGDLADKGFVIRYEVGGSQYLAIPGFPRHQNPHVKEAASEIPPPPNGSPPAPSRRPNNPAPCEPGASPVLPPGEHEASRADTDTDTDTDTDLDPPLPPTASPQGDAPGHVVEIREAGKRGRAKRKAKPAPSPEAVRVLTRMAELSGCRYEASPALEARLREGVPVEDCLAVVEHLARDPWWLEKRFAGPEAPFRRDKFPGYLAQAKATPVATIATAHPEARADGETEMRRCSTCREYAPHRWTDDGWVTDHDCAAAAAGARA